MLLIKIKTNNEDDSCHIYAVIITDNYLLSDIDVHLIEHSMRMKILFDKL